MLVLYAFICIATYTIHPPTWCEPHKSRDEVWVFCSVLYLWLLAHRSSAVNNYWVKRIGRPSTGFPHTPCVSPNILSLLREQLCHSLHHEAVTGCRYNKSALIRKTLCPWLSKTQPASECTYSPGCGGWGLDTWFCLAFCSILASISRFFWAMSSSWWRMFMFIFPDLEGATPNHRLAFPGEGKENIRNHLCVTHMPSSCYRSAAVAAACSNGHSNWHLYVPTRSFIQQTFTELYTRCCAKC